MVDDKNPISKDQQKKKKRKEKNIYFTNFSEHVQYNKIF